MAFFIIYNVMVIITVHVIIIIIDNDNTNYKNNSTICLTFQSSLHNTLN